jgi:ubiquinone/menaquinone biosynthesis C-methylase UbiE
MKPQQAYNSWAEQYDTNENKTRDLEAQALRNALSSLSFTSCLEIGCGTGKNTKWLLEKADHITAVDLSEAMLAKAREKISSPDVKFIQADINSDWNFTNETFDLITFSLVLEHIEHLDHIFREVFKALKPGGYVYIGELHPFKQYSGSKARFETEEGMHVVQCYNHNVSDFVQAAKKYGLGLTELDEYFDDDDRTTIPRILTLLLQKTEAINFAQ